MTNDNAAALEELEALRGALPPSQFAKEYGLPKSTVYEATRNGVIETIVTAGGHRLIPPRAQLAYLTGAGDRARRIKGCARQAQRRLKGMKS